MGLLNIAPATRAGAHLLVQLYGGSRSGKTLSALKLARGIAGPAGKIGVLCTESGRARLYSDKVPGGFFVGELTPPFTPDRYRAAIKEFLEFGVDVLVVDSFSHVWEGEGGVLDKADENERNGKRGLLKWAHKREYKRLVNSLLTTRLHVIFCSRAKQPMREVVENGKKSLVPGPWEPIQDRNLRYEMTVVLPMEQDGRYSTDPQHLKAPGDLLHLFDGEPVTEATGAAIGAWVAGGEPINHEAERFRVAADEAASLGMDSYATFWKALTKAQQKALLDGHENRKSIAVAADAEREQAERGAAEREGLDNPFQAPADAAAPTPHDPETGEVQP